MEWNIFVKVRCHTQSMHFLELWIEPWNMESKLDLPVENFQPKEAQSVNCANCLDKLRWIYHVTSVFIFLLYIFRNVAAMHTTKAKDL